MIVFLQTMRRRRGALINNRGSNTVIQESNFVENSLSLSLSAFWKLSERNLMLIWFTNFRASLTFVQHVWCIISRIIHQIRLISFGEVCFTLKICYRGQCMSRYHTSMLTIHRYVRSLPRCKKVTSHWVVVELISSMVIRSSAKIHRQWLTATYWIHGYTLSEVNTMNSDRSWIW